MENQTPKLTKAEIAALDFLIEEAKEQGGTMAWPGAAARAVGAAVGAAVAQEAVSRIADRILGGDANLDALSFEDADRLMEKIKDNSKQESLTLEQLIEIRNKLQ